MMTERKLPEEFINQRGNGVTEEFKTWCRPLLGSPLPKLMDPARVMGGCIPITPAKPSRSP